MPRLVLSILAVAWCATGPTLRGADDPRALVERALNAMGGPEVVKQQVAVRRTEKGTVHNKTFEGVQLSQPDGRKRVTLRVVEGGREVEKVLVIDGERSWRRIDGTVFDVSAEEVRWMDSWKHPERVTNLVDLLSDKGFTLAALDEVQVDGRPAAGVKVSHEGKPDVSLYFDRETGLLVKYAYRGLYRGPDREALHETTLGAYRDPLSGESEERILKAAGARVAGPVEYLRAQVPTAAHLEKARTLIAKLGAEGFEERERAVADLVALGPVALPALRAAARDRDLEVSRRAVRCLQEIGEEANRTAVAAAVRLVALRRPAGATEALLNLLPGADETLTAEVKAALFALAQGGKPDEALVRALQDKDPALRAAAAAVLGKDGGAYAKEPRRIYTRQPRVAAKGTLHIDGKLQVEMETLEVEFFTRFPDKEFARP
jgi:hypothetical protein